jgi:hypothetical protein
MKTQHLLMAALLAGLFAPAMAEESPAAPRIETQRTVRLQPPDLAMFDGGLRLHDRIVKNAPYSAQTVAEISQALADGNQIASKVATMSYRDSAGRTRQEIHGPKGDETIIIRDDTATWILRPADKTGTKVPNDERELSRVASEKARAAVEAARASMEKARDSADKAREAGRMAREQAQRAREEAREKTDELRREGKLGPNDEVVVKRVERTERMEHPGADGRRIAEEVRVRVARDFDVRGADIAARIGPAIARAFGDAKYMRNTTSKDLGTRDFNGVKAEGHLRSYEIPACEVGNKNPIVVSDETWYAPDLKITVYSKHTDPRSGDRVYRLENLKREEPAAALFSVPAGYTVKDVLAELKGDAPKK